MRSDNPKQTGDKAAPVVSFVSLGCPKALVDSERIITRLRAEGYELTRTHAGADLVVVNTCGFLDSAQAESLGAIGEALASNGKVIVTGCMGAEPEKITDRYPAVVAVTGPSSNTRVSSKRCIGRRRRGTTRSLIWCRRRVLSSRHATMLISRFQRVATIVARSALFPNCAATWSPARPATCCAKQSAWWRPG